MLRIAPPDEVVGLGVVPKLYLERYTAKLNRVISLDRSRRDGKTNLANFRFPRAGVELRSAYSAATAVTGT